ncbi:two-partner secretion domain-containing protein, partial [Schwartzia sp. (in: firmicutes)]
MGRKKERRLRKNIMIGLTSMMVGFMPMHIAGVDIGIAAAEPAPTALPDLKNVDYVDAGGSVDVRTLPETDGKAVMDVVQYGNKAIIDWNTFDVGKDSTVNFIHLTKNGNQAALNTAASTLNRVTGGKLSEIAGTINSVGSFILINPNGAVFTKGSEVNAAGIIVSTANIADGDYKKGNIWFDQTNTTNANIIMDGKMNAETGTDKTSSSGANVISEHLKALRTEGTSLAEAAKNKADAVAAEAAQAKLDSLKATA